MTALPRPTRAHVLGAAAFVAATVFVCAALVSAAVLVPAPPGALPMIVAVCVGLPMIAAYELSASLVTARAARAGDLGTLHLEALRRELERLPETQHPLGL